MNEENIIKKLLGKIQPVGETYEDEERYNNLQNYEKIVDYTIKELLECAKLKNDYRASMSKIGDKAFDILKEVNYYLQDMLPEILEENNE